MTDAVEQSRCCRHASRFTCTTAADSCPRGYKSHAIPDEDNYETACECGAILLTTEAWKNCSGRQHVYLNGATRCACLKHTGEVK